MYIGGYLVKMTWLVHNLWIKVWALILAVGLWFYVAGEETVQADLKIPLQLVLANGMVVTEQKIDAINVSVGGRREVISKLAERELVSQIDLTSYTEPKTVVFSIERRYLPLDPSVNVLQMVPERLEVKIDRLVQKVMPVRVETFGEPATGYKVESFIIDPISALVRGPEGYLKDMVYIDTEPVDVTGRQKSFRKMVPLKSIPMLGEKSPPQFVEVVVKIMTNDQSQMTNEFSKSK